MKNLLVKDLPKIQESIGNLQTTKADKSELSNYATKTDLTAKADRSELGNYATKDDLNNHQVDLSNYATKTDLTTKADKSELSSYATKDDLNNHQVDLSNYATKSDLDNKVDRSDLNNYAYETQKELSNKANSSELDSYATKGDLDNKADKSELSNYAKTGDITTAIQNVRIKQDSLDSDNNYTSGKIYSPEWSDGHLTFDMSGSYATYKTRSLVNHMSAMQEQITQLQLEVKKIVIPVSHGLSGTVYNTSDKKYSVKFFIPNIDLSVGQWELFTFYYGHWSMSYNDQTGKFEDDSHTNKVYCKDLVTFYDDYGKLKSSIEFTERNEKYSTVTRNIPISIQDNFLIFDFGKTGIELPRQTSRFAYYIERSK